MRYKYSFLIGDDYNQDFRPSELQTLFTNQLAKQVSIKKKLKKEEGFKHPDQPTMKELIKKYTETLKKKEAQLIQSKERVQTRQIKMLREYSFKNV